MYKHDYYDNWDKKFDSKGDVVDDEKIIGAMVDNIMDDLNDDGKEMLEQIDKDQQFWRMKEDYKDR